MYWISLKKFTDLAIHEYEALSIDLYLAAHDLFAVFNPDLYYGKRLLREKDTERYIPLGGLGEVLSGHKGYGIVSLVELFTGVLAQG